MAGLALDNTWMQAQDRAAKAGRILGEVLEKRVQGERPVVLVRDSHFRSQDDFSRWPPTEPGSGSDWLVPWCSDHTQSAALPRLVDSA